MKLNTCKCKYFTNYLYYYYYYHQQHKD